MTKEDFLIYVVFHMFKHYAMRGAGIRPILDIYLYVKSSAANLITTTCRAAFLSSGSKTSPTA